MQDYKNFQKQKCRASPPIQVALSMTYINYSYARPEIVLRVYWFAGENYVVLTYYELSFEACIENKFRDQETISK